MCVGGGLRGANVAVGVRPRRGLRSTPGVIRHASVAVRVLWVVDVRECARVDGQGGRHSRGHLSVGGGLRGTRVAVGARTRRGRLSTPGVIRHASVV
eukprot:9170009-Heterocapsa_arctica.AAC.1